MRSLRHLLVLAALAGASGTGLAQDAASYPDKPIRIVVPFAPGGSSDVLARSIGQKLTEMWGQQVLVDNRPGAGGNIGAAEAAHAEPDGYTLVLFDIGTITISPSIYSNLGYDPVNGFAPVTMVAVSPHALVVNPSVPVNSVEELIAYAKANPDTLNFASAGNGTAVHLAGEQFQQMTETHWTHVPYKGGAAALVGIVGGEVDLTLNGLLATLPHIKSGKLKALAVAGANVPRQCQTYRRSARPACRASSRARGKDCWRRPARRRKSWPRSMMPSSRR